MMPDMPRIRAVEESRISSRGPETASTFSATPPGANRNGPRRSRHCACWATSAPMEPIEGAADGHSTRRRSSSKRCGRSRRSTRSPPAPPPRSCSISPIPACSREAVAVLAATKPGAKLIARALRRQEAAARLLPAGDRGAQKVQRRPGHRQVAGRGASRGLAPVARTGPDREDSQAGRPRRATPGRGRDLYLNTKLLACATCHRMEGVGGSVGPDLTRVWDTMADREDPGIDRRAEQGDQGRVPDLSTDDDRRAGHHRA